jgi:hypothetical protein
MGVIDELVTWAEKVGVETMTNTVLEAIISKRDAGELIQENALAFTDIVREAEKRALKKIEEAVE